MYLPHIKNLEKATRQTINVFGGYNHTHVISASEFYHMENMTSDMYPVLSVRGERQQLTGGGYLPEDVFFCADVMADLLPPRLVLNGLYPGYDLGLVSGVRHSMAMMDAYLVIFPEGVYVNTVDTEEWGSLEDRRHMDGPKGALPACHRLEVISCDENGDKRILTQKTGLPDSYKFTDGDREYLFFPSVGLVYRYDADKDKLGEVGKPYVKITNSITLPTYTDEADLKAQCKLLQTWTVGLKANDYVELSGLTGDADFLNGKHVVRRVNSSTDYGEGWIVVEGYVAGGGISYSLGETNEETAPWVQHVIPPLDYVISCGNRLWGCRYGEGHNGEFVNEIYATELGDFRRWYFLADDSKADNAWIASIGHMGAFTGAVSYGGRPYFFKQDRIFSVYGEDATTFGYTDFVERGVQAGCDRSLCVLDGVLYYKALDGIVAFDGSSTSLISSALGAVRYKNAVGGGVGGKYYVSMKEMGTGNASLFVYDTRRGLWHREDGFAPVRMATDVSGHLWGLTADGVLTFIGGDPTNLRGVKEGRVPWMVETGIWGLDDPDKKYVSRISLRLSLDVGAYIKMSIQYDSVGDFEQVLFYEGVNLQTLTLPVTPRRCDHMRIRLEGKGNVRIYGITKTIEGGSDQ